MISCPSCKDISISLIGEISSSDIFGGRVLDQPLAGGELFSCNKCNLKFRFPRLNKKEMDALYLEGEFKHWQYLPQNREDWKIAAEIVKSNFAIGKILDVGCFDGQFLNSLGNSYELMGIEIHKDAARHAEERGVQIVGHDYESIDKIEEKFDVVIATDVVEHTPDPFIFLRTLSGITKKSGLIILATGNTDALAWRLMGSRYWYCAIPEHISFINPGWCVWAAEQLGLIVEASKNYCHKPVSLPKHTAGIVKNLLFLATPNLFSYLRRQVYSDVKVSKRSAMMSSPPVWHGAVDHFLTVFRKK